MCFYETSGLQFKSDQLEMAQRDTYLVALLEVQNIAITEYGLFSSGCLEHLLHSATLHNARTGSNVAYIREVFKKSKWKFKMAFAIRRPTPPP